MSSKICPIGMQNFEKIRKEGLFYTDKTALAYQMVKTESYYLLNRPCRFGKSSLVPTLETHLQGKKGLFEGLAIEELEKEWIKHPVLHLGLSIEKYDSLQNLEDISEKAIAVWEKLYKAELSERSLSLCFAGVIERTCKQTGHRVAILVDEYDKPILQSIRDEELQKEFRKTLQAPYGVIKAMGGYIQFAFLTGVAKLGRVSVFSALNNLTGLSMDERYVALRGIAEEEIRTNLEQELHELADRQRMGYEEVRHELRGCYDGYHSVEDSIGIYNPLSLLNTLYKMKSGDCWLETGTSTYPIGLLRMYHHDFHRMAHVETDTNVLDNIGSSPTNPISVIYQSGYLTTKGYGRELGIYRLGSLNREVEEEFMKFLLPYYADTDKVEVLFEAQESVREARTGGYDSFPCRSQSPFADTTYGITRGQRLRYQNVLFVVFKSVGSYINVEYRTSRERVDLALQIDKFIYVMELKLDGTAEEALRQISEKYHTQPPTIDSRKSLKISVDFSAKTRNIERWIVEFQYTMRKT